MADGDYFAEAARAVGCPHAPVPGLGLGPPLGWKERLKAGLANSGSTLWFLAGLGLLYALRVPLRLCDNVTAGERPKPGQSGTSTKDRDSQGVTEGFAEGNWCCMPQWVYFFFWATTIRQLIVKPVLQFTGPSLEL